MTSLQVAFPPVPTTVDNPDVWDEITSEYSAAAGVAPAVPLDAVAAMVGSAVPLVFAADASGDAGLLRGTFADPVVAQCERFAGSLGGATPESATVHLVGAPVRNGQPRIRIHVLVAARSVGGSESMTGEFWDLQLDGSATVGALQCPSCGAPVAPGALVCSHCRTDVRSAVRVPLLVDRLERY